MVPIIAPTTKRQWPAAWRDLPALAGVWVLVLAAGGSRRYGRPKLLTRIGGETLLSRAARLAQGCSGRRCIVVLGANATRLAAALPAGCAGVVVNRRWRSGLASSLAAGLGGLPPSARAAMILLADQHAIERADLERLLRLWLRQPGAITAACWDGTRGPPLLLPRRYFGRARSQQGDFGARALLRDPSIPVQLMPLPTARLDLDRPGDRVQLEVNRRRSPGVSLRRLR